MLSSQEKEFTKNKEKVISLIDQKEKLESYVEQSKGKINEYKRELSEAKNWKEELEALISNATKREKFREIQERLTSDIKRLQLKKNEKEKSITSMLFSGNIPWLLLGLQDSITKFDILRQSLNTEKTKQQISKDPTILLPEGSPDVPSLKRMLEKEICEVCGREAIKNSDAWKHIEIIMNRPQKEEYGNKNNFSQFYSNIQTLVGSYFLDIPEIGQHIKKYRDELDTLQYEIKKKEEEYEDAKLEYINVGGGNNQPDKDILSAYSLAEEKAKEKEKLIVETKKKYINGNQVYPR